jgi:hypothetical protein
VPGGPCIVSPRLPLQAAACAGVRPAAASSAPTQPACARVPPALQAWWEYSHSGADVGRMGRARTKIYAAVSETLMRLGVRWGGVGGGGACARAAACRGGNQCCKAAHAATVPPPLQPGSTLRPRTVQVHLACHPGCVGSGAHAGSCWGRHQHCRDGSGCGQEATMSLSLTRTWQSAGWHQPACHTTTCGHRTDAAAMLN